MKIKTANNEESNQVKKLWLKIFDDSNDFVNYFWDSLYNPNNNYILTEGGEVLSSVQFWEKKIVLQNRTVSMPMIFGVCTKESRQGEGLMSKIFEQVLPFLKQKYSNVLIQAEHYEYYKKYNFQESVFKNIYGVKNNGDEKTSFSKNDFSKINTILEIYNKSLENYFGYSARNVQDMKHLLKMVRTNGCDFYNTEKTYFIYSSKTKTILEMFSIDDQAHVLDFACSAIKNDFLIESNFTFDENEIIRKGSSTIHAKFLNPISQNKAENNNIVLSCYL